MRPHTIPETEVRAGWPPFLMVPAWICALELTAQARSVYLELARYADNASREAFPSRSTLAEGLGVSDKTVRRAILELETAGALTVTNRPDRSNLYTLHLYPPAHVPIPPDTHDRTPGHPRPAPPVTSVHLTTPTELDPQNYDPTDPADTERAHLEAMGLFVKESIR